MGPYQLMPGIGLTLTPLLVAGPDGPRQVCRLSAVDLPQPRAGSLSFRRAEATIAFPVHLPAGSSTHEILLPETTDAGPSAVELTLGDDAFTREVPFAPVRRWQVFLVNHSHTDIGFTHTVGDVVTVHNKNLERALELAAVTEDWPAEARFRWTVESAWQVQNYLKAKSGDRDRLVRAVREGVVEVEALYIHSYFDLLSREQLVRSLYLAQELRETLGIPITSAMICDVPGCAWSLVDPLAAAGVRYLGMAPNNFLAPFHAFTDLPRPFVWQGPAKKRVLVWYTDDPYWAYIEGARHGFWAGLAEVEEKLPAKLAQLERDGYALDILQIQTGSDNRPLRLMPSLIVRDWNRKYVSPRLRVATPSEFFREVEANWTDRLTVVNGEWQSSWSQTTMHYPKEAAESRRNHGTLDAWERLAVVADWLDEAYRYPGEDLAATYDASLLFDEHSGPKGIWRPRSEAEAAMALEEGYAIFERATVPARDGLARALAAATGVLAGGDEPSIVVWNPLGRTRGGSVEVNVPGEWIGPATTLVEDATSHPLALDVGEVVEGRVVCRFDGADVPAIGFKRYRLTETGTGGQDRGKPSSRASVPAARLERGGLSFELDATGTITQFVDARTGIDLAERSKWPGLNALVRYLPDSHGPAPGGDFNAATNLYIGTPVEGQVVASDPVETESVVVEESPDCLLARARAVFAGIYERVVEIRPHDDWLEIRNRLTWLQRPPDAEMLYVIFPFALPTPRIRHAAQYAVVDPEEQTLSGSSLDAFAIQDWVDVSADGRGVTLHSADLPLVEYGGINLQRFLRRLDVGDGILAFKVGSGQALPPGDGTLFGYGSTVEARFALRPYAGEFDPVAAGRFGEEQVLPLRALALPVRQPGAWKDAALGFVDLRSPTAMLTGLKRAEREDGWVLRIWESGGRHAPVSLAFPHHELLAAWTLSPAEGTIGRIEVVNGRIGFEVNPFELKTIRVILAR